MSMKKKKLRAVGKIMTDIEPLIDELAIGHEMQRHEILALVFAQLDAHHPQTLEEYEDGSEPIYKYRPSR